MSKKKVKFTCMIPDILLYMVLFESSRGSSFSKPQHRSHCQQKLPARDGDGSCPALSASIGAARQLQCSGAAPAVAPAALETK